MLRTRRAKMPGNCEGNLTRVLLVLCTNLNDPCEACSTERCGGQMKGTCSRFLGHTSAAETVVKDPVHRDGWAVRRDVVKSQLCAALKRRIVDATHIQRVGFGEYLNTILF